ncbi:MAG: DUF2460 domain-containing protein [Betaproteobacteria bacterium]|nr:DUF2460 domain-containing protein [Betaproteobacteria bacterium]
MSYNTFPTLPGIGWPIKVTPKFKTIVQQAASGAEFRTGLWSSPLHEISVPVNFMDQADWRTLVNFFEQQQGSLLPFYFTPTQAPWQANALPFGNPWNGSATSAQLVDSRGNPISSASNVSIYRADWQGNQLLSTQARTNLSFHSTDATNWILSDCTLGAAITAPDGTANNFYPIIPDTSNVLHYTRAPAAIPANTRITHSFYAKAAGYSKVLCETKPLGGDATPQFDLSAGSVNGTGTNTTAAINPVAGQPGVFRCSVTFTTNGSYAADPVTFINVYAPFAGDGVSGVYIWGRQTEVGDVATPLIPTTTAPVTLTDYTLTGTTVNLAQAPADTATTTWSGTGSNATTYLVRFPDDIEFEQIVSQIYKAKTLKLQEVR